MENVVRNHWKTRVPGGYEVAVHYSAMELITFGKKCIEEKGSFSIALSGGSTPKAIYEALAKDKEDSLDWEKVSLFWSDERDVPLTDKESNYRMAMEAAFDKLPVPKSQIFPMITEGNIEKRAEEYEALLKSRLFKGKFDLMMLGLGDDGHTASLFPKTHALHAEGRLVVANYIPQKDVWRMTVTFDCINQSNKIAVYAFGAGKTAILQKVLTGPYLPDEYPILRVGTDENPATFILDDRAWPT